MQPRPVGNKDFKCRISYKNKLGVKRSRDERREMVCTQRPYMKPSRSKTSDLKSEASRGAKDDACVCYQGARSCVVY